MTFTESIPMAKQLAENQLKKGFDVEAFLILCEINKMDMIPESNVDEHISDIGKIFIDYYYNKDTESLNNLLNSLYNTLSEIYHTIYTPEQKELFKSRIQSISNMFN